jgi:hypothetical protein
VREARVQADAGQLPGFIGRGDNFGMAVMLVDTKGNLNRFDEFRHAAVKRRDVQGVA